MASSFPRSIVCLTTETVEIVYRLGAGDQVGGVSGYTVRPPEARRKPKIGAYTSIRLEKIQALKPDLILGFSDLQADIAATLIKAGFNVLVTNQRSIADIELAIRLIGGAIGRSEQADALAMEFRHEIDAARARGSGLTHRPRVLFEEWDDPLISGIRWVSELIEIAGGQDLFEALSHSPTAADRVLDPDEVLALDPEVIIASWCGKKMQRRTIERRPGWKAMSAVRAGAIYEIKSADILQPGPGVLLGLRQLQNLLAQSQIRA